MRVHVDPELCEQNGVCVTLAPDIFELRTGRNTVLVLVAEPSAELHAKVEDAADGCPRAAIGSTTSSARTPRSLPHLLESGAIVGSGA